MRFTYCPDCGARLIEKEIGDEGRIPWCEACKKPWFDLFSTCVIGLVVNEKEEAALLRQAYISDRYHNLVSGYMKPGERAEETMQREINEELGMTVCSLRFQGSYWFAKKDMLMLGFFAEAKKQEFVLSGEVDSAVWIPVEKAISMVHPAGSVSHALLAAYLEEREAKQGKQDN